VKITFVDFPGHPPQSVIFAKYFLYAANGEEGYKNAIKARNTLYELAVQNKINTDAALVKELKKREIVLKSYDHKPVFNEWKKMVETYKITQTPTCVLKYSNKYMKKFSDTDDIRNGLLPELEAMETKSKK
jgi:hypothetical protein